MATRIGSLIIRLAVEHGLLQQGLARSEQEVAKTVKTIQKRGKEIADFGKSLSAAVAAPLLGLAAAATAAVADMANEVTAIKRAAEVAGAGFEEFQRAAYAALIGAGIESEKLGDILKDTQDKIGDFAATGGGELKGFFETIAAQQGLTVDDFLGKGSIEQLRLFVSTLEKAGVPSEQMVFYLESIADEGSALLPILRDNGLLLDQLGNKASIIDRQAAAELKEYAEAQNALGEASRKLTIALVKSGLIEGMTKLVENVASFTAKFAESNPTLFKFTAIVGGVATALGPMLFGLGQVVKVAGGAIGIFQRLKSAFDIAGLLKNLIPMIATLGRVMLALVASNPLLAALTVAIGLAFAAWQNWDKIVPIVRNMYVGVKTWLQDKLGAIFDWVGKKIEQVTGFFFNMYDAVVGNSYVPDMVDGIGVEFARLKGLMVDPAERATASVTEATRQMASDVAGLLDRLFPEFAAARQMADELALIDGAGLNENLRSRARQRLLAERYGGKATVSDGLQNEGPLVDFKAQLEAMQEGLGRAAETAKVQTVQIAESFRDMADKSIQALDRFVGAIKGGGFLDILGSAVNLFLQLASTGVFGKKLAANVNAPRIPGNANGTAFHPGGLMMVGERGPEILQAPRGARVVPNHELRAANDAAQRVHISVSVDDDGKVRAYVQRASLQAAQIGTQGGAALAQAQLARRQQRQLR